MPKKVLTLLIVPKIVPIKVLFPAQYNFPDQWCMVLPRGQELQRFAQIRQVGFSKGEFLFNGDTPMSYVLLRLPENNKIKMRVRQIIIDGVGGDGTVFLPDFELQVKSSL